MSGWPCRSSAGRRSRLAAAKLCRSLSQNLTISLWLPTARCNWLCRVARLLARLAWVCNAFFRRPRAVPRCRPGTCPPALSTKHSRLRDEVDPTGFGPAHLASNGEAEHGWELRRWWDTGLEGPGHLPPFARPSRRSSCNDPLRPAKADLVEVQIRQMRADVVKHTRDGAADPVIEAFR